MNTSFGARLHAAVADRGPLCVGIDPHASLLRAWGLSDDPDGLARFADTTVAALAGQVAVLKPQSAFFERHGARGVAVLEDTVRAARAAGALVLLDVKRGDIGSTAQAYADAYLPADAALSADAITVNPYLGFESLRPFLDTARAHGAGVFVLGLTSNPHEGSALQRARVVIEDVGGGSISHTAAGEVLARVRHENLSAAGSGSVGIVVGATLTAEEVAGHDLDVAGPVLAPGVGEQGSTADHVRRLFAGVRGPVLPSVSRDVLAAGPDTAALSAAALRHRDAMAAALGPWERPAHYVL